MSAADQVRKAALQLDRDRVRNRGADEERALDEVVSRLGAHRDRKQTPSERSDRANADT